MGVDAGVLDETLRDLFSSKGEDIAENNIQAARGGSDFAKAEFHVSLSCALEKQSGPPRMLLSGNDAVALGAMAAGCQFISEDPQAKDIEPLLQEYL